MSSHALNSSFVSSVLMITIAPNVIVRTLCVAVFRELAAVESLLATAEGFNEAHVEKQVSYIYLKTHLKNNTF